MRTRYLLTISLLFAFAPCPAEPQDLGAAPGFDLYSLLGTVTVQGTQWQRIDIRPHLKKGKLEAAIDLELFLDEEGQVRDLGWDFSTRRKGLESVLRKIHFIRYGRPEDPSHRVYFRLGDLDDVTLGHGAIMRHYRNDLMAPGVRKTGLDWQMRDIANGSASFRGVVSSLLDLDGGGPVVGGRVALHPTPVLGFGTTLVVDTDQLSVLPDSLKEGLSGDAYGVIGIDAIYHFVSDSHLRLDLYAGISRSLAAASGFGLNGPGIGLSVGGFSAQLEYRWMDGRIRPGHFDALYELNRAVYDATLDSIVTQQAALDDLRLQGIFGSATLSLGPVLYGRASYQHLTGVGGRDRTFEARVGLKQRLLDQLPRLARAEAFYEARKRDVSGLDLFDPTSDTRFGYRLGFTPIPRLTIYSEVEFTYEPDESGGFRRRRQFNLQSVIGL